MTQKNYAFLKPFITLLISFIMILSLSVPAYAAGTYVHDPMKNPGAAKDIIVNPDAVYGYSPSPDSTRLKAYVDYDWTDENVVNEMREQREAYHESIHELYDTIAAMKEAGNTIEEIARVISTRRNEIRLEAYKDDPEGLEKVKSSNLETYGNENGGTPDFFFEKYGSWETVLEKALSTNAGADACLGLYDKYYDTYIIPADIDDSVENDTGTSDADTETGAVTGSETITDTDAETITDTDSSVPEAKTYTVRKGDYLWKIAKELLGNGFAWRSIYELNRSLIANPDLIYTGQVLLIP